jgi:hypothetical protein
VTGSVLFSVASVPYLFVFDDTQDERIVDSLLATQFVIGSVLFLAMASSTPGASTSSGCG